MTLTIIVLLLLSKMWISYLWFGAPHPISVIDFSHISICLNSACQEIEIDVSGGKDFRQSTKTCPVYQDYHRLPQQQQQQLGKSSAGFPVLCDNRVASSHSFYMRWDPQTRHEIPNPSTAKMDTPSVSNGKGKKISFRTRTYIKEIFFLQKK